MKKWTMILVLACAVFLSACTSNVKNGVEYLEAGKYEEAKDSFEKEIEKGKNLDEDNPNKGPGNNSGNGNQHPNGVGPQN